MSVGAPKENMRKMFLAVMGSGMKLVRKFSFSRGVKVKGEGCSISPVLYCTRVFVFGDGQIFESIGFENETSGTDGDSDSD